MSLVEKKQREQTENNQSNPGNKNSDADNSNPNTNVNNDNSNKKITEPREIRKLFTYPVKRGKTSHSTEKCYFGDNAANRLPPRHRRPERQNQVQERANQSDFN